MFSPNSELCINTKRNFELEWCLSIEINTRLTACDRTELERSAPLDFRHILGVRSSRELASILKQVPSHKSVYVYEHAYFAKEVEKNELRMKTTLREAEWIWNVSHPSFKSERVTSPQWAFHTMRTPRPCLWNQQGTCASFSNSLAEWSWLYLRAGSRTCRSKRFVRWIWYLGDFSNIRSQDTGIQN